MRRRIAVYSDCFSSFSLSRQIENGTCFVGDYELLPNPRTHEDVGAIVVFDHYSGTVQMTGTETKIFLSGEPRTVRPAYSGAFRNQFDIFLGTQKVRGLLDERSTAVPLPWFVGLDTFGKEAPYYNYVRDFKSPKTRNVSVITSNKVVTKQHRKRLDFVLKLKEEFKDKIDIFGRGFKELSDKSLGLAQYKYHIALENCSIDDYWTEKLADPFLMLSFPIYYGCSNLGRYFGSECYQQIDIEKEKGAFQTIQQVLEEDFYDDRLESLKLAKTAVLGRYNLPYFIADVVRESHGIVPKRLLRLKPESRLSSFVARRLNMFGW